VNIYNASASGIKPKLQPVADGAHLLRKFLSRPVLRPVFSGGGWLNPIEPQNIQYRMSR